MTSDLGEVEFKKGPDVLVMVVLVVLVLGAFGFVGLVINSGGPADDDVLKLVGVGAVGLLAVLGIGAMTRELTIVGSEGVLKRNVLGTKVIRFADATSVAISRVGGSSLNADLRTGARALATTLTVSDGKQTIEVASSTFGADASLEALGERLTSIVSEKLLQQADASRVELIPGVSLFEGHVRGTPNPSTYEVPANVAPPRVSAPKGALELGCEDDSVSLQVQSGWAYLTHGSKLVAVVNVGAKNFFPMVEVLKQVSTWTLN